MNNSPIMVGYCRVSTQNQRDEGTIDIQRQAIIYHAANHHFELVETFEDNGVSGGLENRPGLSDLFTYIEKNNGIDGVLIYKLDRLARDLYIQEHLIIKLEQLKVSLISIKEPDLNSDDPMRKAFRQFMGIVSELEKSFITMRLSDGRLKKAKGGKYAGGRVPLGYHRKEKDLMVDSNTSRVVKQIYDMKSNLGLGLREIARELNKQGIPTASGGKWYASTVKYILENGLYKGVYAYKDIQNKRADLDLVGIQ